MRLLLILLVHPAHLIKSRERVPTPLIHLMLLGYGAVCGMSFQFLYPRLLNNLPYLGALRKLHLGTWNPGFDLELFLRGSGMAVAILLISVVVYFLAGFLGKRKSLAVCYLAGMSTCIPLAITCGLAFGFYFIDKSLGLAPVYGLLVSAFLQAFYLRDLFRVNRALTLYSSPLVLSAQVYLCYYLLP